MQNSATVKAKATLQTLSLQLAHACLALAACLARAQVPSQSATPPGGPIVLQPQPALAPGLAAMPRLDANTSLAPQSAARINASLSLLDAKALAAARDCDAAFVQSTHKRSAGHWTRTVEVTFNGPGFLSLLAHDTYDCAAYPTDDALLAMVYDLATGAPINWQRFLPPQATFGVSNAADGSRTGIVAWPALTALARQTADPDCKDLFAGSDPPFTLWLDARAGLVAQPSDFPHATAACAVPLQLDPAHARTLAIAPPLIEALTAARALQQ